ncbi:MAG: DUF2258 domain-containing protein [Desulfurococcaceae archaeon]
MSEAIRELELNTGIIIAGAYADKVRRTAFAQLSDLIKQNKEIAKEVARATAELNMVLYHILVENLKIEKGDAVRIRIKYIYDSASNKLKWKYDSLRVEVFKRVPDEQVAEITNRVMKEKLEEVQKAYATGPEVVEEKPVEKREVIERLEKPMPELAPVDVLQNVASVDIVGEIVTGGYLAKLSRMDGVSMGLVSLTPSGEDVVIDAVVLVENKAFRYMARTSTKLDILIEEPGKVLEILKASKPTQLSKEEASRLINEKMQSLI